MTEHATTSHPLGAFAILVIIVALVILGIGAMNGGDTASAAAAGVLLFGFGTYVILALAKD